MKKSALLFVTIGIVLLFTQQIVAQTTEFTYQGRLLIGGLPANGSHDFEFRLFYDVAAGTQLGPTITLTAVQGMLDYAKAT